MSAPSSSQVCLAQSTQLCTGCGSGGACPAECIAVDPAHTAGTVYGSASDGATSNPLDITPAAFVKTAMAAVSGTAYKFAGKTTLDTAKAAITKGLMAHPEYWVPAVVAARGQVRAAAAAPTGDVVCDGVYLPQKTAGAYFTTPMPTASVATSCQQAVAHAVSATGADGASQRVLTNTELVLMCEACGIEGVMAPVAGLTPPSKRLNDLAMAVGIAAALLAVVLGIVLGVKHHKAKAAK